MTMLELLESVGFLHLPPFESRMMHDYRTHGTLMGFAGYDEFVQRANSFYDEAKGAVDDGCPGYTRVNMSKHRVGFDYKCTLRGIYSEYGKPIAFFKPFYLAAGFATPKEELEAFKKSGVTQ